MEHQEMVDTHIAYISSVYSSILLFHCTSLTIYKFIDKIMPGVGACIIPALRRLRQEDCELQAHLGSIVALDKPGIYSKILSQNKTKQK
jgi:hypothetical protein